MNFIKKNKKKKNNNYDNSKLVKDKIFLRIKKSIFDKELYNKKSILLKKISISSILLAISILLSLIELKDLKMPWGSSFAFRFFDTLILIYSISVVGLSFALINGIILPWIHNLIDSHHIWIEMLFFMITNIFIILITWFIYYIVFNAYYKTKIDEDIKNHDIHEFHLTKQIHDHHHKISKIKLTKKIIAFFIIINLCSLVETFSLLIVCKILLSISPFVSIINKNILFYNINFNHINHKNHNHIDYNNNNLDLFFSSYYNIFIFLLIFYLIFLVKYILNLSLFFLLERKTRILIDKFGIYT